jgi:serine/threonine protein kinase
VTSELRRVGPWELLDELGHGGNSTVYRARVAAQGELLALKVLDTHKIQSERYARFVHEVRVLEDLRDFPGVLPLRDAELPERPSRRSPAWLAMPIATPLDQALSGASVGNVVSAIRSIAETLSRLKKEHGIGHRDIKPGNPFELDSQYLVGDFGLVALPDAEPLATDARPVGSRHYMPYEMFTKPSTADAYAVDVYCLAKTLWVQLTEQNYPLEGHQAAGSRHFSLVDQRPHPGAVALDGLIDRMTLPDPTSDLRWSRLLEILVPIDVSDLVTRFRSAVADELDAQDEHARQIQGAASAIELVSTLTRRYDNAIGWLANARISHHPLCSCKKSTMIFLQERRILHGDC